MKKIILPLLAVVLAAGFSAFTAPHASKKATTNYFYVFTGTQTVAGRETLSKYILNTPPTTDPNCIPGGNECAVELTFTTGTEPSTITTAQKLTFDGSGFPNGQGTLPVGTFDKNEVQQ